MLTEKVSDFLHSVDSVGSGVIEAKMEKFSSYQKFVVGILAFIQFSILLNFAIIPPLGAALIAAMKITPRQFSVLVSSYIFSAGISSLLAAGFIDRFDRKKILLFLYSGFCLGILCCGLAPNYELLLLARIISGIFGGVSSNLTTTIVTDIFMVNKRGRALGIIQTAYAVSQTLGIPLSLYLTNVWNWHLPFLVIAIISFLTIILIVCYLKPSNTHLAHQVEVNAFQHFWRTLSNPHYRQSFATTACTSLGIFLLFPFGSAFAVYNLGVSLSILPWGFMIIGFFTIIGWPLIGWATDRVNKLLAITVGSIVATVLALIYTRLGITPLFWVLLINILMTLATGFQLIPTQTLISTVPEPASRGAFMAINSSIQKIAGGIASLLAGWIVVTETNGSLAHYELVGYCCFFSNSLALLLVYFIYKRSIK